MKSYGKAYLLLLPQMLLSLLLLAGVVNGIVQSLGVIPALDMYEPTLDYYRETMSKNDMVTSVLFTLYIAGVSAFISTAGGVLLSAMLVLTGRTKGVIRRIIELPVMIPHVVVAMFVINMLSANGLAARVCAAIGLIEEQQQFLNLVYDSAGIGVIAAYVWKELPFIIFFVISLMANIDGNLGEAAMNLGAGRVRTFIRVTLPLCRRTIVSGFLIVFVYALGSYELPFLLGPTTPKTLPVLAYVQYIHPDMRNRPYAMALNGIIIGCSLLAAVLFYLTMRRDIAVLKEKQKGGERI